jgi:Ca2+/H+ antiporter, TMEM165/GDT1 family
MKLPSRQPLVLVLLLPLLSPALSASSFSLRDGSQRLLAARDDSSASQSTEQAQSNPVGTKDAPIDGKDGKPHAGPFVETEAERDRKKVMESTEEEPTVVPLKESGREQVDLRLSNDGVMDDINRVGPKDGTRGTEGGMSEKTREKKFGEEKKPDPPREAPPLPHSEQVMIKNQLGKESETAVEEENPVLEVSLH